MSYSGLDGIGDFMKWWAYYTVATTLLALWKILEIAVWIYNHINIEVVK